jgi:hypothetical protein
MFTLKQRPINTEIDVSICMKNTDCELIFVPNVDIKGSLDTDGCSIAYSLPNILSKCKSLSCSDDQYQKESNIISALPLGIIPTNNIVLKCTKNIGIISADLTINTGDQLDKCDIADNTQLLFSLPSDKGTFQFGVGSNYITHNNNDPCCDEDRVEFKFNYISENKHEIGYLLGKQNRLRLATSQKTDTSSTNSVFCVNTRTCDWDCICDTDTELSNEKCKLIGNIELNGKFLQDIDCNNIYQQTQHPQEYHDEVFNMFTNANVNVRMEKTEKETNTDYCGVNLNYETFSTINDTCDPCYEVYDCPKICTDTKIGCLIKY